MRGSKRRLSVSENHEKPNPNAYIEFSLNNYPHGLIGKSYGLSEAPFVPHDRAIVSSSSFMGPLSLPPLCKHTTPSSHICNINAGFIIYLFLV